MKKIIAIIGFFGAIGSSIALANAGYFDNAPAYQCDAAITRTLQVGSQNSEVYLLQDFLSRAGYLQANPNGNFGAVTRSAVRSFQYDNNIPATGSVGEMTRNAINERLCDTDVRADNYDGYGYGYGDNSGMTYVDNYDPFATIMLPKPQAPAVYNTPGNTNMPLMPVYSAEAQLSYVDPVDVSFPNAQAINLPPTITTAPTSNQIASTQIVYNPFVGYTYGITPRTGTLTVMSPVANTVFREGDTVNVNWATDNINANNYQVLLENTSGGLSKVVAVTNQNSATFVLTRDILDAVCSGDCITYGKMSYRIVIATPLTDIANQTSMFRASVSPIIIERPLTANSVSITASQNPVASGEGFRLYINIPTGASWNAYPNSQYSFKIRAICPSSVSVNLAGATCGQDFVFPIAPNALQQSIPAAITNSTWFGKQVIFELTVTDVLGRIIGTSQATVTVSGLPFTW